MNKKQLIVLVVCMVFGVGILFSLFALSPFAAAIPRQSFNRKFDNNVSVEKLGEIDLKVNSFYIAGKASNTVYLGNWTGPFHLVAVTLPNLDTVHMNMKIDGIKLKENFRLFRMKVDSPFFYLSHGVLPGVFKGLLSTGMAKNFLPVESPYFTDAVPVNPSLIVLKSFSTDSKGNELAILKPDSPYFEFKPEVLEKQIDGIFCVDGALHYDREINKLVYVYAYRNEYVLMDTSLKVVSRSHTIDTFSVAPIKVANVKSKGYITLASPPAKTNLKTALSKRQLFIESPLLARDDNKLKFQSASTIDVYDVVKGQYLYSFYLDALEGYVAGSMEVIGNYLIAIYDRRLVIYRLTSPSML